MSEPCNNHECLVCLDCRARALYSWDARIELLTDRDQLRLELERARATIADLDVANAQLAGENQTLTEQLAAAVVEQLATSILEQP
jgi:hypothetical protein